MNVTETHPAHRPDPRSRRGADQPPTRGDVDRIVEIARANRPATPHTLRIADVLNPARPARRQRGDAVLARAGAAFAAVRKHAGEAR